MKKMLYFLLNYYAIEVLTFFGFLFFIQKQVEVKSNLFTTQQVAQKLTTKKLQKQGVPYLIFAFGRILAVSVFSISTFWLQDKPSQQQKPQE